ncbi:MAG: YHS domain-containing (seleno)protein [Pseudomonadota bacterium]
MLGVLNWARGTTTALAAAAVIAFAATAQAGSNQHINTTPEGVAIDGYDTVAYFTTGAATKGDAAYTAEWEGATWHFASAENRDTFTADPAAYAPQHGGWCSYAASDDYIAEVDVIDGWSIQDGKLYLNWDVDTKDAFVEEADDRIASAHENWPGLKTGLSEGAAEISRHADYPDYNPHGIAHPQ